MGTFEAIVLRIFMLVSGVVAMLMFGWQLKRRNYFWLRLASFVALYVAVDFVSNVIISALEAYVENAQLMFFLHCMYNVCTFAGLVGFLCLVFNENFIVMLFCGISGKCMMHIAEYVSKIIFFLTIKNTYLSIAIYIIIYLAVFFIFAKRVNGEEFIYINNTKIILFAFVVIVATDGILIAFSDLHANAVINVYMFALITILCVVVLFLQYNLLAESRHKLESIVIGQLREKEREQYEISKETINLIGVRQHDLKSMLQSKGLGLSGNQMAELVKSLDDYELPYKTGNGTLDIILMEKYLVCRSKNIQLEVMVDGSSLGFLNEMDIYSLFLNALNNAIEATEKIEDEGARVIRLKGYACGELVMIQVKNPYTELVRSVASSTGFSTTKPDKNNHGFGLRSIKMIVDKYGGELGIKTENNHFCLGVVFPINGRTTK